MIRLHRGALTRALLSFALLGCASAAIGQTTTYDFGSVSSGFGNESIPVFGAPGGSGVVLSGITTINLPVALSSRTAFYDINSVVTQDPFAVTQQWSGRWQMSNNNGDGLYGTFSSSSSRNYDFTAGFGTFTVFTGYTGNLRVFGGTGFYSGAWGGGSFESYVSYTGGSSGGDSTYHSVNVDRLHVTLPYETGIEQTNTRGLAVLMLTGSENSQTGVGHNEGPIISTGGGLPPLTYEVNNYSLVWPDGPPYIGAFLDTNELGDTLEGTFNDPSKEQPRSGFGYNTGKGIFTKGTGAYAGMAGGSDYENFSIGLGLQDGGVNWDYMLVTVARSELRPVTAVPEPESWAMLLAGLAMFGAYRARRARRSNA